MPRLLKIIFYAGVFLFSFILFTYWMLPMETVKAKIIGVVEKQLGPDYQVQIEKVKTYRISGVRLDDLVIQRTKEGKTETLLRWERLRGRVSLFSLLFGNPKFTFDARNDDARITGLAQREEEGMKIQMTVRDVDVSQIPFVQLETGLALKSSIEGKVNLNYNTKQPLRTEGEIDIRLDELNLKKSTIPLGEMGTFPLPELDLASAQSSIKATIGKGSMRVEALALKGKDFNLDVKGRVFLAPEVSRYRINLQGTFQFSPKIWAVLDPLLPEAWASELKKQKGSKDNYPLSVSGQLNSPQVYSGTLRIFPFKPF